MKTYKIGVVSAAILMVAAAAGMGIAQTGGDQSSNPAWTRQDQAAVEQYIDYAVGPQVENRPVLSFFEEGSPAIETGAVPASISEESWKKDYGND